MSVEIKVTADTRKASEDIDRLRSLLKKVQDDATRGSKKTKIIDITEDQAKVNQLGGSIKDLTSKIQKQPKYKLFDDKSLSATLSQTEQINKNINTISVSAGKLGSTLKSAFAVGAVTLLGSSMLRTAQTFESLRTRLNVATGSLNKAQRAFSDIQTFAAQTKFSVDALTDSYARLANTGSGLLQTNGDILNGLEAIANAVTAVGGGDYEIQRVAEAFARMAAEGRVTYERLEPLTTAGISLQKVAAAAGKSWSQWSDKMAQGNLTFEEVFVAFNKLAMSTQGFGGIARKQTNSLSGAFSNLGDSIKGFQDAVINSTGLKDIIISVTNAITSSINLLTRYVRNDLTVAITQFKLFVLQLQIGFLRSKNIIQDFQKTVTKFDFEGWLPDFSKYRLDLSEYLPNLQRVQQTIFDFGKYVKKVFYDVYNAVVGNSYWPDTIKGIAEWSDRLYGLALPGIKRFAGYVQDIFLDIKDAFFMWKEKIDLETRKRYNINQRKHLHPLTLTRGNIVSSNVISNDLDPKDDLLYGFIGTSYHVDASLISNKPLIESFNVSLINDKDVFLSWKISGNREFVDHIVILREIDGIRKIIGKTHCLVDGSLNVTYSLTQHDIGNIRFILVPVYNDFSSGQISISNELLASAMAGLT